MKRLTLTFLFVICAAAILQAQWVKQGVNTTASFRGLAVVNDKVIWASGTDGTVIKTIDGGKTWKVMTVPGAEKLDFRDIEAFDAKIAYILSIGNGENSRIYKTIDGGKTWKLQFKNANEKAFFDAIACWDRNRCIAMSDPVDGHYLLVTTVDGGKNWKPIAGDKAPAAKEDEAAFAASGTCLIIYGKTNVFLVSGDGDARVFRSSDRGMSWNSSETPMDRGVPGRGIFSIAMNDANRGVIVGGNYPKPEEYVDNLAFTTDGGKTWKLSTGTSGYRSGVAYIDKTTIIAVGTNGTDVSSDGGKTWKKIGDEDLNAVQANGKKAVWAVGPKGLVVRMSTKLFSGRIANADPNVRANSNTPVLPYSVEDLRLSKNEIIRECYGNKSNCDESKLVEVATLAPEVAPPSAYVYDVSAGKIIGDGANVTWDLTGVKAGTYLITAGISQPFIGSTRFEVLGKTVTKSVVVR